MHRPPVLIVMLVLLGLALLASQEFSAIAAGAAIFLFGMLFLQVGFTAFTGGVLEKLLRASTDSLFRSHVFGIVSTALMQSSSLVSVITISFLGAGLITLSSGIGIIFGANIGTTTGAWLMAAFGLKIKISAYAMPMLIFGLVLRFQDKKELKGLGNILAGLGFLFLGIHYMKEGFESFQGTLDLVQYAVDGFGGLLLFTGIGVVATVIMQSSHATLMLIITALAAGQVTYQNALALAVGANIGTTITAILGSVSSNVDGRRLAGAHVIFNSVTALIAIGFIDFFTWAVDWASSAVGIAATNWTLKLAMFHTIFNVVGVVVIIPLIPTMVRFLEHWTRGAAEPGPLQPLYINESALKFPDTAVEVMIKESGHLFDNAFEIIAHGINIHRHDILSTRPLDTVVHKSRSAFDMDVMRGYYESIKVVYNSIIEFATKARVKSSMTEEQSREVDGVRIASRHIAQTVKHMSAMRDNLVLYLNSDNEHISREYDVIRLRIAGILREILNLRHSTDEVTILMTLTKLKEELVEDDVLANGTVDRLVRDGLITSQMATSLMNDSESTHSISALLIAIAERLFIVSGMDLKEIGEELLETEGDPA